MDEQSGRIYEVYSEAISGQDYHRGIERLSKMLRESSKACDILHFRSHLHRLAGNTAQAKCDLDDAIGLNPKSRQLYYDRGALHHHTGAYYLALKDFCEAASLAQMAKDDDLIDAVEHHIIEILDRMRSV